MIDGTDCPCHTCQAVTCDKGTALGIFKYKEKI